MRASRLIAGLVVVALVATVVFAVTQSLAADDGGSTGDPGPSSAATLAPTPTPEPGSSEAPTDDLASFYGQTLDWQICPSGEDECATLTVPVDYQHPDGETIELAVLRAPAADQDARIGSMVVDPGGPGASAVDYASSDWGDALSEHFDIVGMDPRGVGESVPIDCLSDKDMDAYLAGDPDPDTPEEVAEFQATNERFAAGCEANAGDLAAHVSTIEAARDMDVLRSALGETELTYFGASYGTELGATYAEYFPDRVGRMVLDGAVDPTLSLLDSTLTQAEGFETALRSYIQNCLDEGDCFLGDTLDEGLDRVRTFLEDTDQEPLPTQFGDRMLTEGLAGYGIIAALYSRDAWMYLDQGLQDAFDGDGTILALLADSYASRDPRRHLPRQHPRGVPHDHVSRRPDLRPLRRGGVPHRGHDGGLADLRPDLRLGDDHVCGVHRTVHRDPAAPAWGGRGPDRGDRYDARPSDALRRGRRAGRPARVSGAGQPRRRRPHRLQLRQRLRGRGGRGLPRRRHRAPGRVGVLDRQVG